MFSEKLDKLTRRILTILRLPISVNTDSLSYENSSDLDIGERKRLDEGSLEASSNADQLSNSDDEKADPCEPNHMPNTNQTQWHISLMAWNVLPILIHPLLINRNK